MNAFPCRRRRAFPLVAGFLSIVWLCLTVEAQDAGPTLPDLITLFHTGRVDEAEAGFRRYLSTRPNDPTALYYMGRLTDDVPASTRYLQRVVDEYPGHPMADDALFALCAAAYTDPLGLYLKARRLCEALVAR